MLRARRFAALCAGSLSLALLLSVQPFPVSKAQTQGSQTPATAGSNRDPLAAIASLSSYFIENRGQVAGDVLYYSRGNPSVAFRNDGVMFVMHERSRQEGSEQTGLINHGARATPAMGANHNESFAYIVRFEGANIVKPIGRDRMSFSSNFLMGSDPAKWRTDVPSFREVVYSNLYTGIDLVYRQNENGVKYEFLLAPGTKPDVVTMRFEGVDSLSKVDGEIVLTTAIGEISDSLPRSYQGTDEEVDCNFVFKGRDSFGFACGDWDRSRPLVIDPLIYSTYLGGAASDRGYSIQVDATGNTYITGQTFSGDFPKTPGSFDTTLGGTNDAFLTKLNAGGTTLVYSTYIGGSSSDIGLSVALDSSSDAYVAGSTASSNFPVIPGAFDTSFNGNIDIFVTKLNAAGNALLFSTFLGGPENETWPTIAVDTPGKAFLSGTTESPSFPTTPGAYDRTYNGGVDDIFVSELDSNGAALIYSTFLGGDSNDFAYSIDIDSYSNAFVTGGTFSTDFAFPSPGYDKTPNGDADAFVAKVNATGSLLDYATYLGGTGPDFGLSVAVDLNGRAHVAGSTDSADFPTSSDAYDKTKNSISGFDDAFMTELSGDGTILVYSTYFGGSTRDHANAIVLDEAQNAHMGGWTDSANFPVTAGAYDPTYNGNGDAFVVRFDAAGLLANSTYLGGTGSDGQLPYLAIDASGADYVTSVTFSSDFPTTPGAFDTMMSTNGDCFVTKLGPEVPDLAVNSTDITFTPPGPVTEGALVLIGAAIHNLGTANASSVVVRFYDGTPSGSNQIGPDQVIVLIVRSGGTRLVSVAWTAVPPGSHDICVVADPDNTIAEGNEKNNMACKSIIVMAVYIVSLTPGHRFMSFPLVPSDDRIESVLSSIPGCYDYVRFYDILDSGDHWKSYVPGRSYNDLKRLDNSMGFWIDIRSTCNFVLVGVRPSSTAVSLHQGWNMVGFPSFNTSYRVADLNADLGLAGIVVEAFDPAAAPYYLQRAADSYVMMTGEGYWVYAPSDTVWTVYG